MNKVFLSASLFSDMDQSIVDKLPRYIVMSGVPLKGDAIDIAGNRWEVCGRVWGAAGDQRYHPVITIR